MSSSQDLVLFRAAGRAFTARHVLSAADFRGELVTVRQSLREELGCLRYGEDEGFDLDVDDLNRAAESYRLDHDLITAEDTERWLARYALTVDDFSAWLERRAWRERFARDLSAIVRDYCCSDEDVETCLWPEVVFGDHLRGFCRQLAARVATLLASGGVPAGAGWPEELAAMEAAFRLRRAQILSVTNVERELGTQGPSLLRVDVEIAVFSNAEVAREAWACAAGDGEPLGEVAERAGAPLTRARVFLDDLPEPLRQPVWSAVPGQVLPPVAVGDAALVCCLHDKAVPSTADDEVRRRVESILAGRVMGDLVQAHIEWTDASGERPC